MANIHLPRSRGIVLLTALLTLAILTLIALCLTFVSSTEVLVNESNEKTVLLLYAAESACEEARLKTRNLLDGTHLSFTDISRTVYLVTNLSLDPTLGDEVTNPYFDSNFDPSQTVSILPSELGSLQFSWVKIWPKTESRAGYSLDDAVLTTDPVFYGFSKIKPAAKPTQYVNSGIHLVDHIGTPVFLVTALAKKLSGYRQVVSTDIARVPCPPLAAVFFSKEMIQIVGSAVFIDGNDQSTVSAYSLDGVESQGGILGDTTNIHGAPLAAKLYSPYSYEMQSLLKMLSPPNVREVENLNINISKSGAGEYVATGITLGTLPASGDISQAVYVDGPLSISNSSGQGILVINGDLVISGEFTYHGLIIVNGKVLLSGAGSGIQILGALIAGSGDGSGISVLDGIINMSYDSSLIRKQFENLPYARIAFRDF